MRSDTSSEVNVNYLDNTGRKILTVDKIEPKRQSSDTDFYFDMVANQEKIVHKESESESSEISNIKSSETSKSSSSSSSSSKSSSSRSSSRKSIPRVEKINLSDERKPVNMPSYIPVPSNIPINNPIQMPKTIPNIEPTLNTQSLSPQEIRMKKIELLRRLCEIKAKGFQLTKEYDFNSSIEEMEYEHALLKSFADKRNGVKLYKSFLLNGVSLIEFMNDKYDPFDFKLSGWSEHMSVEVDSYDDVLEELYEKYKGSGGTWPPEMKLALLIIGSGAGYHFTKSQLGTMPGMNPGSFLGKMMNGQKKTSQFMSPQEINIENQKKILKEKEMEIKQKQRENIMKQTDNSQQKQPDIIPPSISPSFNFRPNIAHPSQNIHQSNTRDAPEIRAPENVQEILARIKHIQQQNNINSVNTTETQDEQSSNNDRLLSDTTISNSDTRKRGKKQPNKKPIISINT
jgi:hypothetical protein